jgi:methylglutamate dehydrogenase subunit C
MNLGLGSRSGVAPLRLPRGGLIDRGKPLGFTFDGHALSGFHGDTLASALIANAVKVVGRSFKYHRPRGIVTTGSEEPNALVELRSGARREPNSKATTVELYQGLQARSQHHWPSLRFDLLALSSVLGPLFPAGFYYKTFMWPRRAWERLYEPMIRRAAGLGRAAGAKDPDHYEQAFAFCDVLVVGGGPSGLMAAIAAARAGARVIVCDEDFCFGGRLLCDRREVDGMSGPEWVARSLKELAGFPEVRMMSRTTVFGAYDGGTYGAVERVADHLPLPPPFAPRQRLWRIVAKRAVVAAGAVERGIAFGGNDRPGIMMGSAMRAYVNRFAVAPGRRTAIFTNNDEGWRAASDLTRAGVEVVAVIDPRDRISSQLATNSAVGRVIAGGAVVAAHGRSGLHAVEVRTPGGREVLEVDALGVSGGPNPAVHLTCHCGGWPRWDDALASFVPGTLPDHLAVVGAANGTMTLAGCLAEGAAAGVRAAEETGFAVKPVEVPRAEDGRFTITPIWHVAGSTGKAFVDVQNDVTVSDIALAVREGFRSTEHLKRYTTLGMGTDQGKTANVIGLAILTQLTNRSIAETGPTSFRPPYTPVAIGALAGYRGGKHFRPARLTPSHRWAERQGAVFVETALWLRAQYFPRAGDREWLDTVSREVRTVRSGVGFCDVSTLGKVELQGRDVPAFLDRLYINDLSTLKVGRVRYGVMLREDGFVLDDGTVARLAEDRFFMTTTTADAARVFQHMQLAHQVLWPELDLHFASVTDQWAQYSIAGPRARDVLAALVDPAFDVSNGMLPTMAAREVTVCNGVPARLYRISYSGELAYEIAVPARYGEALADRLMEVGNAYGIIPYGTEALGVMRIEKGHVAGNEIDGRTTARDLGLGRMMSSKKDFIGRVMATRPALCDPARPSLVGLKPVRADDRLRAGAHLIALAAPATAQHDEGVVTSAAFSPSCGHSIGLGLLARGPDRIGERIRAVDPVRDGTVELEVCKPCFIDPEGERLRV